MIIDSLVVGPFEENCWLLHDPATREGVLIDPGDEPDEIIAMVERAGSDLIEIWLTHAHLDHIGAVEGIRRRWPRIPVHLHAADLPVYAYAERAARNYGIPFEQPTPPDRELHEGDVLALGALRFAVWHLPGHAPGHVAFIGEGHCFSGDLLFAGSIGRTDLPLSDPAAMSRSLRRLTTIPHETHVHPGHGPGTSIGVECRDNPFLNGAARVLGG
jgi:glyoxylase-like metal-dependent hydrolase (beta-lactamase superfamily II)